MVYGLDLKSFENLAINMEQIKRYIEQQNEVILYYEKAVREEPKIVEEDLDGKEVFSTFVPHEPTIKGTSQGKKPITSTMNKHKRRSFKKYRGQGR